MKQLLNATRAKVISFLHSGERTVKELAEELDLTTNAVRAHLESLQRNGIVQQSGFRSSARKPHRIYKLTPQGERLLFQGCEPLLTHTLAALAERLHPAELKKLLRDVGKRMAAEAQSQPGVREVGVNGAISFFNELGSSPSVHSLGDEIVIQSSTCPWAMVVANHSELCSGAEALVSALTGMRAKEQCVRASGGPPRCSFRLQPRPVH